MADGKVDQTYVGLPVTLREDQVCKALLYQGTTGGYGMAITKSCEDPVRAIKFMDYLCSDAVSYTHLDVYKRQQKALFTYFAKVPGMDIQILDAMHGVYH